MRHTRIYISAGCRQDRHRLRAIREVTRPVCRNVQQRSRHTTMVNDSRRRERRILMQLSLQALAITGLNRRHQCDRVRVCR